MLTKTRAIVLHSMKYGEDKTIVDMLTADFGRVSFVCRLPKTQKGKLKKQLFQPLTMLFIEFDHRQGGGLQRLRDVQMSQPFTSIPFDPVKLSISLFVAEFLLYATRGEQQNEALFQYVENGILWLDGQSRSFANFHLVFMMRLSRFIGFFPNLDDYHKGDCFDLRNGTFVAVRPSHADVVEPAEAERINTLMRMGFESMHLFQMNRHERNRIAEFILTYYRLHVPNFPELKSIEILKELFEV